MGGKRRALFFFFPAGAGECAEGGVVCRLARGAIVYRCWQAQGFVLRVTEVAAKRGRSLPWR